MRTGNDFAGVCFGFFGFRSADVSAESAEEGIVSRRWCHAGMECVEVVGPEVRGGREDVELGASSGKGSLS